MLRRCTTLALCLLLTASTLAAVPYATRTLTPQEATEDVLLARRALEMIHPGLYRYTARAEMDDAFSRLEARARQPITDVELYGQVSLMLARIHCDHTKAELPAALEAYRASNPTHLPFRFQIFEGRMYVVLSDPGQTVVARGTEVLSINGLATAKVLETLAPAVSYDGLTSAVIPRKLADDPDLMGSNFDQFYPTFFGMPARFTFQFRDPGSDKPRTAMLNPISYKVWKTLRVPGAPTTDDFYRETTWRMLNRKTAYLKIDTFVNYHHPVDAEAFYAGFFRAINLSGADHLIVDLRQNSGGGGFSDPSISLIPFLVDRPFIWNKPVLRKTLRFGDLPKYITSWGDPKELFEPPLDDYTQRADGYFERVPGKRELNELPIKPSPDRFAGRVTVLTGPANGSGSTMVIAKLKDAGRVQLVGMPTGGSAEGPTAGTIFFLKLPNSGMVVHIPNLWNRMNIAKFRPGYGVAPDVEVEPTLADLIAGKDATLEAALKLPPPATPAVKPVTSKGPASALLGGDWQGQLEYRDYRSDKRVQLPTVLHIRSISDGTLDFDYLFDDGPGKIVEDTSTIRIDAAANTWSISSPGEKANVSSIAGLTELTQTGRGTLVLTGAGRDNNLPARVRTTITLTADTLTITRETAASGADFFFRHRYTFTRTRL